MFWKKINLRTDERVAVVVPFMLCTFLTLVLILLSWLFFPLNFPNWPTTPSEQEMNWLVVCQNLLSDCKTKQDAVQQKNVSYFNDSCNPNRTQADAEEMGFMRLDGNVTSWQKKLFILLEMRIWISIVWLWMRKMEWILPLSYELNINVQLYQANRFVLRESKVCSQCNKRK